MNIMKKSYLFGLFGCLFMFTNCSKSELESEFENGQGEVKVSFTAQIVNDVASRAEANVNTGKNLEIIAYRKQADGNYAYAKSVTATVTANGNEIQYSNSEFKLEIGTYRFLSIYNVGNDFTLDYLKDDSAVKTWQEILDAVKISNASESKSLNINEIFAGGSLDNNEGNNSDMNVAEDIDLSESQGENTVNVSISLSRVNSRIDLRFLKFSPSDDGNEQAYGNGMNIFGKDGNLKSITTSAKSAISWSWGAGPQSIAEDDLKYTTNDYAGVTIGTLTEGSTDFPTEGDAQNMDAIPAGRILKGAAYYKGAYILPFTTADKTTMKLTITLVGNEGKQKRVLEADGVKAEKNKVTVVTFKYRASSDFPDDKENLFNPTIKYDVTIDTQWNGFIDGPSVDI